MQLPPLLAEKWRQTIWFLHADVSTLAEKTSGPAAQQGLPKRLLPRGQKQL